jgi:hypothetical protein
VPLSGSGSAELGMTKLGSPSERPGEQ